MNENILTAKDLQQATGYERMGDVERCLRDNQIKYFHGRKGIWTTVAMVNAAGGILPNQPAENQELL